MHLLSTERLSRNFGSFWANKDVSINVSSGEIVSILGENGAGKTTLMNMLYGLYKPSEGRIIVKGEEKAFSSPLDAIRSGISMVHQHFMLVDSLTVYENIILGHEPLSGVFIDSNKAIEKVSSLSKEFSLDLDAESLVGTLSVGEKQRAELLKALYNECDVLILDEPTAVLTPLEVEFFFKILRKLRDSGKGIILISHKLKESLAVADRIYIMRNGRIVAEADPKTSTVEGLAETMVGRALHEKLDRAETDSNDVVFQFNDVSFVKNGNEVIKHVSLDIRNGRILGVAGVDGNGQSELVELAIGIKQPDSGKITYKGRTMNNLSVKSHIESGIGYIPEDRQKNGLVGAFSIEENLLVGYEEDERFSKRTVINWKKVDSYADEAIKKYDIRCRGRNEKASALSGGNQQKIVIARVLEADPCVIIASQPTRGVDIGAVEYIHNRLIEMRNKGKAVLLVSADLDEIIKLSDDIAVIFNGRIVSFSENGRYTKTELGEFMTGSKEEAV